MWGTTSCACVCVCAVCMSLQRKCAQIVHKPSTARESTQTTVSRPDPRFIHFTVTVYSIARGGARPWARLGDTCRLARGWAWDLSCSAAAIVPLWGPSGLEDAGLCKQPVCTLHSALHIRDTVICSLPVVSRDTVLGAHPHLFLRVPTLNPRAAVRGTRDANPKCARPRLVRPSALLLSRSS